MKVKIIKVDVNGWMVDIELPEERRKIVRGLFMITGVRMGGVNRKEKGKGNLIYLA